MTDKDNLPVVHSAKDLNIIFPEKNKHISDGEASKNREIVKNNGAYTSDGRAYLDKVALPHLLATDQRGVNRIYNDLENADKLEVGAQNLVAVSAVNKVISERIQEPRDSLQKERLRDSEACVNAFRDAPELEKIREVEESRSRKEQPRLKEKKIRAESITACQLTGAPLDPDADAHHIERQADKPRKARDLRNIVVANKSPHREVHAEGAETPEELSALCLRKGWNDPTKA
ncbi:hypothetical protein Q0S19_07735 [Stenotrophomonas indicatrix]|uniref:hypothetical protein n=1 Tax=Stenotrophomonas indicatrix TaxID=2045451 RepID=UPI002652504D|nr:hypothetical protein [Stenotrophomonas indicatrix]MDN8644349.1 hypothetical protein [Stenotrophomonas indicatrix]MDN8654797.1 hypothetical protein [Stenotrophomonas indicatrix]